MPTLKEIAKANSKLPVKEAAPETVRPSYPSESGQMYKERKKMDPVPPGKTRLLITLSHGGIFIPHGQQLMRSQAVIADVDNFNSNLTEFEVIALGDGRKLDKPLRMRVPSVHHIVSAIELLDNSGGA